MVLPLVPAPPPPHPSNPRPHPRPPLPRLRPLSPPLRPPPPPLSPPLRPPPPTILLAPHSPLIPWLPPLLLLTPTIWRKGHKNHSANWCLFFAFSTFLSFRRQERYDCMDKTNQTVYFEMGAWRNQSDKRKIGLRLLGEWTDFKRRRLLRVLERSRMFSSICDKRQVPTQFSFFNRATIPRALRDEDCGLERREGVVFFNQVTCRMPF